VRLVNGADNVTPVSSVRDLGVYLDANASMTTHISRIAASCFGILRQLRSVQRSLPRHAVVSLVTSLVLAKLDYCNALLVGIPAKILNRLQAVINTAARLVCHAMKADHITPVLKDLHWLRIQERIQYKLCVLAFKCQHNLASRSNRAQTPSEIIKFTSARRTSDQKCRHGLGDRAFLVAAASYGMEQSAVNSHCCVNPAFIPSSPEISSIHRICILVTFLS